MEESGQEAGEQAGLREVNKRDGALVSVIVPAYQAAGYLPQCLRGLAAQSYGNLEILVIDDGSEDGTRGVLEAAGERDPRIRTFRQPHRGASAARNRGIAESRGEFLLFCDADDYPEKAYVERLMAHAAGNDLVVCGYYRVRDSHGPAGGGREECVYRPSGSISMEELYERTLCGNDIGGGCWNKLFRADIVADRALRFREDISIGEDMLFGVSYYASCGNIFYVGEALYDYCFREGSLMKSVASGKGRFDHRMASCLEAAEGLLPPDGTDGREGRIGASISYRRIRSAVWLMYQMVAGGCHDRRVFRRMKRMVRESLPACRRGEAVRRARSNIRLPAKADGGRMHGSRLERLAAYGIACSPGAVYLAGTAVNRAAGARLRRYLR